MSDDLQQLVAEIIDKETRGLTNSQYREALEAIITDCECRLDALRDDERRANS